MAVAMAPEGTPPLNRLPRHPKFTAREGLNGFPATRSSEEGSMSRVSMFNSPLLLGFDQLERTLDRLAKSAEGYPPYNIERIGENGLRITLAVAGFTTDDLVDRAGREPAHGARQADRRHRPRLPSSRHRRAPVPARLHAGRRHRSDGRPARQRPAVDRPGAAGRRSRAFAPFASTPASTAAVRATPSTSPRVVSPLTVALTLPRR